MGFVRGLIIAACVAIGGAGAPAVASAQAAPSAQAEQEARAHFQLGRTLYDGGRFEEAAAAFERAYELSQRPQLLYNLFLAHRDAQKLDRAIDALRRYLELVPNAQDRDSLTSRLASMERAQAEQAERERAAQAEVERARREAEERAARDAEARAQADALAAEAQAQATTSASPADATSTAATASDSTTTETTASGPGIGPWIAVGTGGALVAAGIVTAVLTRSKVSDIEAACPNNLCPAEYDLAGARATGRVLAATTDVLLISGGAAIASGILWYFLVGGEENADATASVGCDGAGCMATARVRF